MYKAIIFDFFDVIHRDPFKEWIRANDLEHTDALEESSRLVDLGHISEDEFHNELSRMSGHSLTSIEKIFNERGVVDVDMVRLIEELHGTYKTGLLSNSSSEYLRPLLKHYDIGRLFDVVAISSELGLIKPDPEAFRYILEALGVNPGEAVFVDDNPNNVKCAISIGLRSIRFTDYGSLEQELHKLGVVIK